MTSTEHRRLLHTSGPATRHDSAATARTGESVETRWTSTGSRDLGDRLKARVSRWVKQNLVADDPRPEPSRLDRMDGVGPAR